VQQTDREAQFVASDPTTEVLRFAWHVPQEVRWFNRNMVAFTERQQIPASTVRPSARPTLRSSRQY